MELFDGRRGAMVLWYYGAIVLWCYGAMAAMGRCCRGRSLQWARFLTKRETVTGAAVIIIQVARLLLNRFKRIITSGCFSAAAGDTHCSFFYFYPGLFARSWVTNATATVPTEECATHCCLDKSHQWSGRIGGNVHIKSPSNALNRASSVTCVNTVTFSREEITKG